MKTGIVRHIGYVRVRSAPRVKRSSQIWRDTGCITDIAIREELTQVGHAVGRHEAIAVPLSFGACPQAWQGFFW